eukprot:2524183-Rhodomonas_salina.1
MAVPGMMGFGRSNCACKRKRKLVRGKLLADEKRCELPDSITGHVSTGHCKAEAERGWGGEYPRSTVSKHTMHSTGSSLPTKSSSPDGNWLVSCDSSGMSCMAPSSCDSGASPWMVTLNSCVDTSSKSCCARAAIPAQRTCCQRWKSGRCSFRDASEWGVMIVFERRSPGTINVKTLGKEAVKYQ